MNIYDTERQKKWASLAQAYKRCEICMYDAPKIHGEACCKHHCGEYDFCEKCDATCRELPKLCEMGYK